LLWRAVARARLGKKADAKADAQRAATLGFESKPEQLVVLALAGDPEAACRAILENPRLADPSFAGPFVARAASVVGHHGGEADALRAVETALLYAPAGSPELRA